MRKTDQSVPPFVFLCSPFRAAEEVIFYYRTISFFAGFVEGSAFWDDKNNNNKNNISGTVPAGEYGIDTKIYYCCSTDGDVSTAILLPTDKPFYLIKPINASACQDVQGMRAVEEWIWWDSDDNTEASKDDKGLLFAFGRYQNPYVTFCYYTQSTSPNP